MQKVGRERPVRDRPGRSFRHVIGGADITQGSMLICQITAMSQYTLSGSIYQYLTIQMPRAEIRILKDLRYYATRGIRPCDRERRL